MKTAIVIVLIAHLSFISGTEHQVQNHKLNSVNIEFVGFDTETFVDVSCEGFHSSFDNVKNKQFFSGEDLLQFKLMTKDFEPRTRLQSFDVRGEIIFRYGKIADKYCFDVWGNFYKDGKFYYNKTLLIYIADKMLTYRHPKYLDTLRRDE